MFGRYFVSGSIFPRMPLDRWLMVRWLFPGALLAGQIGLGENCFGGQIDSGDKFFGGIIVQATFCQKEHFS